MDSLGLYYPSQSLLEVLAVDSPTMTVRDVARYLSVVEKTVYRLAQRGELPGFRVAGAWRFKRQDIEHWIEEQKVRLGKALLGNNDAVQPERPLRKHRATKVG